MNRVFEFTKEDLIKISYFVLCKFHLDKLHHQGTSSKRDLIGGFLDRWINRAAEYVVFNNLLKYKSYKVLPDFFLYSSDSEKNAPDILGLIDDKGEVVSRFSKYFDGSWHQEEGMPFIEVKNCRSDQLLIGVREPQMKEDNFYALIEADIAEDYLTALFDEDFLNENVMKSIKMNKDFIESDIDSQILEPILIESVQKIGTFKLLGIYTGRELKKYAPKYLKGENPNYLRIVEETSSTADDKIFDSFGPGKVEYNYDYEHINRKGEIVKPIYMPLHFDLKSRIDIIKKAKGVVYLKSYSDDNKVMDYFIKTGTYRLYFSEFQRSSSWNEYIGYKSVFDEKINSFLLQKPQDKTNELIDVFEMLYSKKRR